MSFSLDLRAHSEVGLVRKNNQDSGYASPTMLVVADGMGGAAAGDLASAVAVEEVRKADLRHRGLADPEAVTHNDQAETEQAETGHPGLIAVLADAVTAANSRLADLVAQDHTLDGMGTTVCGAAFDGTQLGLVHIGDSRGYLYRDGELSRLTHDHSWVQSLIDEGRITEEEAAVHPHRSLVLKVLNGHPTHIPDVALVELREGDRVMFCSDGLCGFTTDEVIAEAFTEPNLDVVMKDLIQAAHIGGGADNITIIVADVVPRSDELDAKEAAILGAAEDIEIPEIDPHPPVIDLGDGDEPTQADFAATDEAPQPAAPPPSARVAGATVPADPFAVDAEQARYQPTLQKRRRWVPVALMLAVLLVVAGAVAGGMRWSKSQYYVGDNNGFVAVFNGINGNVLGRPLHSVVDETTIEVAGLPVFYRQQVTNSIGADNVDDARRIVKQLLAVAGTCSPPASTSPTPSSPTPNGPTSPTMTASETGREQPPGETPVSSPAVSSPAASTPAVTTSTVTTPTLPSTPSTLSTASAHPEGDC